VKRRNNENSAKEALIYEDVIDARRPHFVTKP